MTVTNNNNNGSFGENNTDRDEEMARALQEQFRNEVESSASPSTWGQIQGLFSSSNTPSNGRATQEAGASAPPRRSGSNSGSGISNGLARATTTPNHKKGKRTTSTPDTVIGSTPSPDRCRDGFPLPTGRPRNSPRSSPRGSPRTSPRGSPRTSPRGSPRSSPRNSFSLSRAFSLDMYVDTANDEVVARRLEQELRDAELAARIAQAERSGVSAAERAGADFSVDRIPVGNIASLPQRSMSGSGRADGFLESGSVVQGRALSRGRSGGGNADSGPPTDCRGKATYYTLRIVLSVLIAGITFLVFITVFGSQTGDALDPASWLPGYPELDPSLGSVGEHNKWKPNGDEAHLNGLTLTVLDNLQQDSDWHSYMDEAIMDWDNGSPDAVTLNMRTMTYDPDCRAVRRAMKVCNANYGPTDWRGVNQILLQDDYIITSLAKMNDYYLDGTNRAQKQYTMCHELGHGLGLGHSDENFHNKDLGNCMDYTERPQNNMHPDTMNFETLVELYGSVNANLRVQNLQVGDRRELNNEEEQRMLKEEFERYAAYLLDPIEVKSQTEGDANSLGGDWRLLRKTDTAELHERQLGNGYSIRTSVLLA